MPDASRYRVARLLTRLPLRGEASAAGLIGGAGAQNMLREKLIIVCTCEIAGRVRGKGFPASELASRLVSGVGWVPTNTMISALGPIGDTPFGATGDLILVPDPTTEVHVDFDDGSARRAFLPRRHPPHRRHGRGSAARASSCGAAWRR